MTNSKKLIGTISVIIRTADKFPDVEDKKKGVIGFKDDSRWFMVPDVDVVPYQPDDEVVVKYLSWEYNDKLYFKVVNMQLVSECHEEEIEGIERIGDNNG